MKVFRKVILTAPLLCTACVAVPLSSCGLDDKNSVSYQGDSKIITTNHKSFTLTLYLQYLLQGSQKVVVKIINTTLGSSFVFEDSYSKYNLVGRRLEFDITFDFDGEVGTAATFDIEVYGLKQSKVVWSSALKGFKLVYTAE